MRFLDDKINYSKQFRFYKNISTSYAIISRNEIIHNCDDDKKTQCVIFIDLGKAFDTVYLILFLP